MEYYLFIFEKLSFILIIFSFWLVFIFIKIFPLKLQIFKVSLSKSTSIGWVASVIGVLIPFISSFYIVIESFYLLTFLESSSFKPITILQIRGSQ